MPATCRSRPPAGRFRSKESCAFAFWLREFARGRAFRARKRRARGASRAGIALASCNANRAAARIPGIDPDPLVRDAETGRAVARETRQKFDLPCQVLVHRLARRAGLLVGPQPH